MPPLKAPVASAAEACNCLTRPGGRRRIDPAIGEATTRNFFGPIETIIPWASNLYTATLVDRVRSSGTDFWGFLDARWYVGRRDGFHL